MSTNLCLFEIIDNKIKLLIALFLFKNGTLDFPDYGYESQ